MKVKDISGVRPLVSGRHTRSPVVISYRSSSIVRSAIRHISYPTPPSPTSPTRAPGSLVREAPTDGRKIEGIGDRAAVVTDLATTVVRIAKAGSIIIAHSDLSVVTHAERLDSVPTDCRHRHCWPSTAFSKAPDQARVGNGAS